MKIHLTSDTCHISFFEKYGYTLPSKRNATLVSEAPMTPILGQRPHRGKKLLKGAVSSISSHRSSLNT